MTKKQAGTAPVQAAALPADTARTLKTTQNRLAHLQELVKLCAFAIEASHTLRDLASALEHQPAAQHLQKLATAPALDDQIVATMLNRVADDMAALFCDLDEVR